MEPPAPTSSELSAASLSAELERLISQANDLTGMNQLSRTFLQLLHQEQDEQQRRVIKDAILHLTQKAVDSKTALEDREAALAGPDVVCQVVFCVRDVHCHRISHGVSEKLACADMHVALVSTERGHEMAFIEVGTFHYPLTPVIPCLRSVAGSYIFPLQEDVFYGISLPDGIPGAYIEALDRVLTALCDFRIESEPSHTEHPPLLAPTLPATLDPAVADRLAASIESGAGRLAVGIENTTALLTAGIEASQGFLQRRIQPLEEPMSVNPFVSYALRGVATSSSYLVTVKPLVISKFASMARFIAHHTFTWYTPPKQNGEPANGPAAAPSPALKVGGAAVMSAVKVWDSLSKAGEELVQTTGKSAAALVRHRYGESAGQAAESAALAVKNTICIYQTRPAQILSAVAIQGGKDTVADYVAAHKGDRAVAKDSS